MSERVSVDPVASIQVTLNGEVVAETTRGFVVHEQGLDDRYYVPATDVRAQLSPGAGEGTCPWKGQWKHLDVSVSGQRIANGAWTYFESKPATAATKDFIAFYGSKFQIKAS
ncbi:DUF427 domain-containing protein [soil metagenome]